MTIRERLEAMEKKLLIYNKQNGRCYVCGKPIPIQQAQLAHRIGQTKANIKKYGYKSIHHEKNMRVVCSLKCNSAVDISFRPLEVEKVLKEINGEYEGE